MNGGFYKDLDTNFAQACCLCEEEFTHQELLDMLKSGNIPQKQIAALKFDKVESLDDSKALLENLTGCDGKIREAVALRIFQIIKETPNAGLYFSKLPPETFAEASIDINANICRLVIDSANLLKKHETFGINYTKCIINHTNNALNELDKFIFKDKKYVINKQLFKLYWCLEALKYFYEYAEDGVISEILKRSAAQKEYTVREKTAQISVLSEKFSAIQELLKNDENYYVRAVFLNH